MRAARTAWVGNSFIYFNDLPAMLSAMLMVAANLDERAVEHGQVTPDGQKFAGHAADEHVSKLLGKPWDVVVLQDHSGIPGGYNADRLAESRGALASSLLPLVPSTARLLVYGTWGHVEGSVYEEQRGAYPDYPTMQSKTTAGIESYLELIGRVRPVELAPVGDAFLLVYEDEVAAGRDPTSDDSLFARLFAPDKFHPSRLGSFLAACVFAYVILAGDDAAIAASRAFRPAESCDLDAKLAERYGPDWKPEPISDMDAAQIQDAARRAVERRLTVGG